METPIKKKAIVLPFIIGLLVIFGIYAVISPQKETHPKSAAGLTEEQRADNDVAVLLSEVHGVEQIEIKYGVDGIKVYLTQKSSEQYVSNTAQEVDATIREAIEKRRADLTLEKDSDDYFVYVYGSDRHLINY
jgi:hypothetical protein